MRLERKTNPLDMVASVLLVLSLSACAATSGTVGGTVGVNKGGVKVEASSLVSWGGNGSQGGGHLIAPDPSMIGLCFRTDILNGDGTISRGTPTQVTGAPIASPVPPEGVTVIDQFFSWSQELVVTPGPLLGAVPGHISSIPETRGRIVVSPLLPDGSLGSENTRIDMILEAAGPNEGSARALSVQAGIRTLLLGSTPDLLPPWAKDVTFSSWRRVTSGANAGDIHLTVGALGSAPVDFRLDVNGFVAYANNGTALVSKRGQWILWEVDVAEADIHVPQALNVWATNELHIEYETDRTNLTQEDHALFYRITDDLP